MYPTFSIFGLNIDSYRLFFFGGCLTVALLSFFFLAKKGFNKKKIFIIFLITAIFSFIGARLFHYFLYNGIYEKNPSLLFNLNMQGQAVIGGLVVAYLSIYFLSKIFKINHWKILDTAAPFLGLGLIIGRIGCFLAGCCFGKETSLPIGITFPLFSPAHKYQLLSNPGQIFSSHPVHPTQIYEMIIGTVIFFTGIYILKKTKKDGVAILSTSIIYLVFRLIDNYFRSPALVYSVPFWFYPSLYIALILIAAIILFKRIKK